MSSSDALWLKIWEVFAAIGFIMVIGGVVIEGVEHFKKFPKKEHGRKLQIEKIGWFIVVVGLAMEFLGDHAARRISDRESARLNKEAADAREVAGKAEIDAGKANERAATNEVIAVGLAKEVLKQAQQIQDAAKTANEAREKLGDASTSARLSETKNTLDLASKVAADVSSVVNNSNLAPLRAIILQNDGIKLTEKQKRDFSDFLSGKPTGKFCIFFTSEDRATVSFAKQIDDLLQTNGYEAVQPPSRRILLGGLPFKGIELQVNSWVSHGSWASVIPPFAGNIQQAFWSMGFKPFTELGSPDTNVLFIQIGIQEGENPN